MARPTAFRAEFTRQAYACCQLGATDRDLAEFFEVAVRTIHRWKHDHPEFCHSLKRGKQIADARVAVALYHRAIGFNHEAVKILTVSRGANQGSEVVQVPYVEHYPPDTAAAIFWLKNRQPDKWREKQTVEVTDTLTPAEREARVLELLALAGQRQMNAQGGTA